MRGALLLALAGLASVAATDERRYLVIPAGHDGTRGRPCRPALSADGQVVAFDALAPLDPADSNDRSDVYLFDRATQALTLVSRGLSGASGRSGSHCARISGDGQRVVFESDASDLVEGDTPGTPDVFLFDRGVGRPLQLPGPSSQRPTMSAAPAISGDGRVVVFHARTADLRDFEPSRIHRVRLDGTHVLEDLGEGHSPAVNHDGSVVAYVVRVPTARRSVIRVANVRGVRTVGQPREGDADGDTYAPALSDDGVWIAYVSRATNLLAGRRLSGRAQVYLEHVESGERQLLSATPQGREANGGAGMPSIDAGGRRVVFEATGTDMGCGTRGRPDCRRDINLLADVFLWDAGAGDVTRVNASTAGLPWLEGAAYPTISRDGRVVAFLSRQPVSEADGRDTFDLFVTQPDP